MQRKATKNTRGPNAEEKRFHRWVKERQACAACSNLAPTILHHCEGSTFRHNKTLVGHWFVIGLCQVCDDVVTHGSRKRFRLEFGPQSKLWRRLISEYDLHLKREHEPDVVPVDVYNAIMDWGR